jgi:uncharacterized protein (DUF2267 family)
MSAHGLETLDHSYQVTHQWINDLDLSLGWNNKPRSYRLLRAVLQTLRDCLQPGEMADLAAQLPAFLRGVYYEQWRPMAATKLTRDRDHFFAAVDRHFAKDPIDDVGDATSVVFALLSKKISAGEIAEVIEGLPAELRSLWNVRVTAPVR